jgi:LysR family transcriptional regulator, transcriptional activator of the cysJI operon
MEDHRLKSFCLVVEMKSFSKAAAAKFMTQSAMSHLIKNLEDEIGVKLLTRSGKSVIQTSAGKKFYEHAKRILHQYKMMENDILELTQKIKGPLSIGASITASTFLLPQVLYSFTRNYPDVQVQLSVSNREKIIHDISEGSLDIGIVEGKIRNTSLHMIEIADDEIVIIASDDNPLTRKTNLVPQDLLPQPFIMAEPGSGIREFVEEFFSTSMIDPKALLTSMTLGSTELIVQMVRSGLGISFVSKWAVFNSIKDGTIALLNVRGKRLVRKIYLVSIDREPVTMVSKTFIDFVKGFQFFKPF